MSADAIQRNGVRQVFLEMIVGKPSLKEPAELSGTLQVLKTGLGDMAAACKYTHGQGLHLSGGDGLVGGERGGDGLHRGR